MLFAVVLAAQAANGSVPAPQDASTDLSRPPILKPAHFVRGYPSRAFRENREGSASYQATIDPKGKPTACMITQSSGSPDLDAASCSSVMKHLCFQPARDAQGHAIEGIFASKVIWSLPRR